MEWAHLSYGRTVRHFGDSCIVSQAGQVVSRDWLRWWLNVWLLQVGHIVYSSSRRAINVAGSSTVSNFGTFTLNFPLPQPQAQIHNKYWNQYCFLNVLVHASVCVCFNNWPSLIAILNNFLTQNYCSLITKFNQIIFPKSCLLKRIE